MAFQFKTLARRMALAGTVAAVALGALASTASAKDYLLVGSHSGKLFLFDAAKRTLVRGISLPGGTPLGVFPSSDGRTAYVMNDKLGALNGVDLDTGKPVFHASLSEGDVRGKGFVGLALSRDDKELYAVVYRTRLHKTEYEVLQPEIQVFSVADGLNAKPIRTFPVARQTSQIHFSTDGSKLYAIGANIDILDPQTGAKQGSFPLRDGNRPNLSAPDMLAAWSQHTQTNVWTAPIFSARTDLPQTDPAAFQTGIIQLDLASGQMRMDEFENTSHVIFSSTLNPANRDEVYGVYTQLSKINVRDKTLVKRVELDHTYYAVNISADGKEVYVGGTMGDIAVYDTATLSKIGSMSLPDGSDMSSSWMQIVKRD